MNESVIEPNDLVLKNEDINNNKEEDVTEATTNDEDCNNNFQNLVELLLAKNSEFGTTPTTIRRFCQRLKQVKTSTGWESFLCTAGSLCGQRYRPNANIRVQPTALSRRRVGITRGSKRRPSGRPASGEPPKKRPKKKHNLSQNVEKVQPHAIKHGSSH